MQTRRYLDMAGDEPCFTARQSMRMPQLRIIIPVIHTILFRFSIWHVSFPKSVL
jgi:hypothetical protein